MEVSSVLTTENHGNIFPISVNRKQNELLKHQSYKSIEA